MNEVDLSKYNNTLAGSHQIKRFIWNIVWFVFARPFPRRVANRWKLFLLRLFGAKVHHTAAVYSTVNVYAPWNLIMKEYSCLAPEVDCYNVAKITLGAHATVSQKTYLCSASHDITLPSNPLIYKPIVIEDQAWIGAATFIGMGVTIGKGAVVGARACVFKDVEQWTIVGGNPAKFIKDRIIND